MSWTIRRLAFVSVCFSTLATTNVAPSFGTEPNPSPVIPFGLDAPSSCVPCQKYAPLIQHALERGEYRVIEKLREEAATDTSLDSKMRAHLVASLDATLAAVNSLSSAEAAPATLLVADQLTNLQNPLIESEDTEFSIDINSSVREASADGTVSRSDNATPNSPQVADDPIDSSDDTEFESEHINASVRATDLPPYALKPNVTLPDELVRRDGPGLGIQMQTLESSYRDAGYATGTSDPGIVADQSNEDFDAYRAAGYTIDNEQVDSARMSVASNTIAVSTTPLSARNVYMLPDGADAHFSDKYRRIRNRYLSYFFFDGMTATKIKLATGIDRAQLSDATVREVGFADQTLHMGQAMLTFAAESSLLRKAGLDHSNSEKVLRKILLAFDELDAADADPRIYGSSKPGFFLRDWIHDDHRKGVPESPNKWTIASDSNVMISGGPKHQAAMSLDQAVALFVGWWAVSRYSADDTNRDLAKVQCDRVMNFLRDSLFFIKRPDGGSIPLNRGPEFRYAAGFLCHMAKAVTGKDYLSSSSIDVTIKGDPIRFRDDNLGEFEIPGYKIPASMKVKLSHKAFVALKPAAIVVMTHPRIKVRFSDLFSGADPNINLPCAHIVQAHPGGHRNMVPCVHMTVTHRDGDLVGTLPCAHMVKKHDSDKVPCAHLTAKHPGGHDGPTLPCAHIGKLHGSHKKKIGGIKVKVPCTHYGPKHPGGHKQTIPCTHMGPKHPGGHSVPCVHLTAKHPAGHKQYTPCVHPKAVHPAGDPVDLPCAHMVQAHPSGHGFDLRSLDIDIPLGDKLHAYARHIVLQCFAYEPNVNPITEFLPTAKASGHIWRLFCVLK